VSVVAQFIGHSDSGSIDGTIRGTSSEKIKCAWVEFLHFLEKKTDFMKICLDNLVYIRYNLVIPKLICKGD